MKVELFKQNFEKYKCVFNKTSTPVQSNNFAYDNTEVVFGDLMKIVLAFTVARETAFCVIMTTMISYCNVEFINILGFTRWLCYVGKYCDII